MAVITLKQLLHRPSPGAAIGPSNPLEVRQYGGDGQPISPATAGGQTTTQNKIDTLATLIGALDASKETDPDAASAALLALQRGLMSLVAKETTLGSVKSAVESIAGEDFATQTTLAQVLAALTSVKDSDGIKKIADAVTVSGLENLATAAKQDTIKGVLDTLATESTLASILAKLADPATQTTLAALKGLFDSGDAKVTLTGHLPPTGAVGGSAIAPVLGALIQWQTKLSRYPVFMRIGKDGFIYTIRQGFVKKINPVNGEVVWEYTGATGASMLGIDADSNGNVYFGEAGVLRVLDRDGIEVDQKDFGVHSLRDVYLDGDGGLYVAPNNAVVLKLDASDLSQIWESDVATSSLRRVRFAKFGGAVYCSHSQYKVSKIDDETGSEIWEHTEASNMDIWDLGVDSEGYVYRVGRYGNTTKGHIIKYDPTPPEGPQSVWSQIQEEAWIGSIAIHRDSLYTVNGDGELRRRDLDGQLVWLEKVSTSENRNVVANHGGVYVDTLDHFILGYAHELQIVGYRGV